jgi:uncharacterized integral membrane protein
VRLDLYEPVALARLAAAALHVEREPTWPVATNLRLGQFGDGLVMTSSFGEQAAVLLHLAATAKPDIKVIFIDTGYLFPETHQYMEQLRRRLNLNVWTYRTRHDPVSYLSTAKEEDATASLGKHVLSYRLQALALGAALAGLAGCVYAWQFSFFSPDDYQPLITFFGWMILILGGVGRVWAVPVGALVFGFLFAATRFFDFAPFSYLDSADRAYVRLMLIGLVIILLVVFRPQGLLGRREEMVLE